MKAFTSRSFALSFGATIAVSCCWVSSAIGTSAKPLEINPLLPRKIAVPAPCNTASHIKGNVLIVIVR